MSTRAIAPVVGVSAGQASKDLTVSRQVLPDEAPAPAPEPAEVTELEEVPVSEAPAAPAAITGLDGKTYTRPEAPATTA